MIIILYNNWRISEVYLLLTTPYGNCMGNRIMKRCGSHSKGKTTDDFDPIQLAIGAEIELEHTCDRELAQRIAMDHLVESSDYYRKLVKMEEQLERAKEATRKKPVKRIGAPTSRIIDVDAFVKRVDNQTKVRKFRF